MTTLALPTRRDEAFRYADLAALAPLLGCETLDIQGAHVPFDGAYADETIGGMMVLTPDLSSNRSQLSRFLEGD